jgi:hypothetical protein
LDSVRDRIRRELARYGASLADWLAQGRAGTWVAIHGDRVIGFYASSRRAWEAAVADRPNGALFVQEVRSADRRVIVSHFCPHDEHDG